MEHRQHALREYATRIYQLEKHINLSPVQKEVKKAIFEKGKKKIFCRKGRKAGGTEVLLYVASRIVGTQKNKLGYLVYPDSPSADRILNQTNRVRAFFPKEWEIKITWTDKKREIYFVETNSRIVIMGAHQWESMQGFEFDFCGFDELADHDPRAYQYCYPNIAARDAVWMVIGAPPLSKTNFYVKIENEALASPNVWAHFCWNLYDNPFLPETFDIEQEKIQHELRGDWDIWLVQWMAEYITGGSRSVIKAFKSEAHVKPYRETLAILKDNPSTKWFGVFDPGFAKCFAALLVAYLSKTKTVYVVREIYETDRLKISIRSIWGKFEQIIAECVPTYSRVTCIYDSAALGFASELRDLKVDAPLIPSNKQKDDEDKYFRMINDLCIQERYVVTDKCPATIFEIENYLTDESGRYPDKDNHTLDCQRYIVKWLEKNIAGFEERQVMISSESVSHVALAKHQLWGTPIEPIEDWPFL